MILEPRTGAYHDDPYQELNTYDFQPIGFAAGCRASVGPPQTELVFQPDGSEDGEVPALQARSGSEVAGNTFLSVCPGSARLTLAVLHT